MVGGSDRVAVDAVGVAILRQHGRHTRGVRGPDLRSGADRPRRRTRHRRRFRRKIEIVTAMPESEAYAKEIRAILAKG
jgi:uncharacterized protein (DUF362 family)